MLLKMLCTVIFLKTLAAKSTLSEKCCEAFSVHAECAVSGFIVSAGGPSIHPTHGILEHPTARCIAVYSLWKTNSSAWPERCPCCCWFGVSRAMQCPCTLTYGWSWKRRYLAASNSSRKLLTFRVAEQPLVDTGSLGPHPSRD